MMANRSDRNWLIPLALSGSKARQGNWAPVRGMIAAQGPRHARELAELIEACDETIPFVVCEALAPLVVQLRNLDEAIARSTERS